MIDFDDLYEVDKKGDIKTIIATRFPLLVPNIPKSFYYSILMIRKDEAIESTFIVKDGVDAYMNDLRTYCRNFQIELVEYDRSKT